MSPDVSLASFNLFSPDNLSMPEQGWALLRREAPVFRLDRPGSVPLFIITRKRDVEAVAEQTELFSNTPIPTVWRWGEFEPAIAEVFAESGFKVVHTLQSSDPPDSLLYRSLAEAALGRRQIAALSPSIDAITTTLIDAMPEDAAFNFVDAFSVPMPLQVICRILGIPLEDAHFIRNFSDEFTRLIDPSQSLERAIEATRTVVTGYRYLARHMERYQAEPADNLLSAIAHATIEGRELRLEEKVSMAHVLTIAGNETTRNALSGAMFELASRPALWTRLRAERARITDFIEEVLRLHSPATTTPRAVTRDTVFEGVFMPRGSAVFPMWGAANRDEEVYADAPELDLDRRNKTTHVTFGHGVHRCIGAMLARAELKVAVSRWLDRFEQVELEVPRAEVRPDPVFGFHAFSQLPVRVRRAAGG